MPPTVQTASPRARLYRQLFRSAAPCILLAALVVAVTAQGAQAARSGRVAIQASQAALLLWIAEERGLFRAHGIDADISVVNSGLKAAQALTSGETDLAISSDTALVTESFDHPELRILAVVSASETSKLIARRDHGITKAGDLAGKRIGVTLGTTGEYLLTRYLTLHGIPLDAARMVNLQPAQIEEELISGRIDAAVAWEPFARNAERALQANAVILPDQLDQTYYFLLLTTQSWAERNPGKVKSILQALIDAEQFAAEQPGRAKAIIRAKFGLQQDDIDYIWPLHSLHVSLPQGLLFVLERQADWQMRIGQARARRMPDFLDLVAPEPLSALRGSAVGIVKW